MSNFLVYKNVKVPYLVMQDRVTKVTARLDTFSEKLNLLRGIRVKMKNKPLWREHRAMSRILCAIFFGMTCLFPVLAQTAENFPWGYRMIVMDYSVPCGMWQSLNSPYIYPSEDAATNAGCRALQPAVAAVNPVVGAYLRWELRITTSGAYHRCVYENLDPDSSGEIGYQGGSNASTLSM